MNGKISFSISFTRTRSAQNCLGECDSAATGCTLDRNRHRPKLNGKCGTFYWCRIEQWTRIINTRNTTVISEGRRKVTRKINFRIVNRRTHCHRDHKPTEKYMFIMLFPDLTIILKEGKKYETNNCFVPRSQSTLPCCCISNSNSNSNFIHLLVKKQKLMHKSWKAVLCRLQVLKLRYEWMKKRHNAGEMLTKRRCYWLKCAEEQPRCFSFIIYSLPCADKRTDSHSVRK